jgi:Holliday junction DNA helicase RuvA
VLGYIKGKVISFDADTSTAVVLSHRVGYEVMVSGRHGSILSVGQTAEFWLYTHVREDVLALYGFPSESEKKMFRLLLSVSGLGPKTALSLLSEFSPAQVADAIRREEASQLSRASGVGKKLAQKIVLELSSKVANLSWLTGGAEALGIREAKLSSEKRGRRDEIVDLESALINLGFAPPLVRSTVEQLFSDREAIDFSEGLKEALQQLANPRRFTFDKPAL